MIKRKYTPSLLNQAKRLYEKGHTFAHIARELQISRTWIGEIAKHKMWKKGSRSYSEGNNTALKTFIFSIRRLREIER